MLSSRIAPNFCKKILSKHQNKISEIDIKYVHKFIKITKYIDNKNYFAEDLPLANKKGGNVFIYH